MKTRKIRGPERWFAFTMDPGTNAYIADHFHDANAAEDIHCTDGVPRPMWCLEREQLVALVKAWRRGIRLDFKPYRQESRDEPAKVLTLEELGLENAGVRDTDAFNNYQDAPSKRVKRGRQRQVVVTVKVPVLSETD